MKTIFFAFLLFAFSGFISADWSPSRVVRANPPPDVPCTQNCTLGVCGNGICEKIPTQFTEENCDNCPADCGLCPTCAGVCGNARCESWLGESACNCREDCSGCCEDGICGPGENFQRCPTDCGSNIYGELYHTSFAPAELAALTNTSITVECSSHLSLALGLQLSTQTISGRFTFLGLIFDSYTCCVKSSSIYIPTCQAVDLRSSTSAPSNYTIRIPLKTRISSITVRVTEAASGGWLRKANVSCVSAAEDLSHFTSPKGTAHFFDIKPAAYVCSAKLPGFSSASSAVVVTTGSHPMITLSISPLPSNIFGQVQSMEGTGVVAQGVICVSASLARRVFSTTFIDPAGRFSLSNVTYGEYTCRATANGFHADNSVVTVEPGVNATTLIRLRTAYGAISGLIQTVNKTGIAGARVTCSTGLYTKLREISNAQGGVQFVHLVPGQYSCQVERVPFPSTNVTVVVGAGGQANFVVDMN